MKFSMTGQEKGDLLKQLTAHSYNCFIIPKLYLQ